VYCDIPQLLIDLGNTGEHMIESVLIGHGNATLTASSSGAFSGFMPVFLLQIKHIPCMACLFIEFRTMVVCGNFTGLDS
jgi:hypothetical protein